MKWEQLETNWPRYKDQAKSVWKKLSEDELEVTRGRRDKLIDKVRDAYHYSHEDATQEVDAWVQGLR